MFEKKPKGDELKPPPIAFSNSQASEVLRVWSEPDSVNQIVLNTTWKAPGAWGLLLADLARHAAKAYANEGHDHQIALDRIKQVLDAEWSEPTDSPIELG